MSLSDPSTTEPLPRSLARQSHHMRKLLRERLWLQVMIGMVLGLACGAALDPDNGLVGAGLSARVIDWLALPGELFLGLIGFVVVPLILASVVRGIAAGERQDNLGQIGGWTISFFLATTVLACLIGFGIAGLIEPGTLIDASGLADQSDAAAAAEHAARAARESLGEQPKITQQILSLLPSNPHRALAEGDTLQVVIIAAIVGLALLRLDTTAAKPLLDLMAALQSIAMVIVQFAMRFAPIAVFGLMARLAVDLGLQAVTGMSAYVATVVAGLALLFAVYLAAAWWLGGVRPVLFLTKSREALMLAFSTSSSAAVMPVSLNTAEHLLGVRQGVARFVIPLGATINMGGTALYQAIATLFLAQVFGIDLGPGEMGVILVMAVGAAIGSPGAPGVGIVVLATILESVGIPASGLALIIGIDRLLDMCRTVVNVGGDLTAAVVINAQTETLAQQSSNDGSA